MDEFWSMKACAILIVFIYTANTLLVLIICHFKILYKSDNSIWIITIKNNETLFLLTLNYPIRNWFLEIRKVNSVVTALKFQQQKLLAPEETAFSSLWKNILSVKTLMCETNFTSLEIYLNKRPPSMGSYCRNVQPLIVCRKLKLKPSTVIIPGAVFGTISIHQYRWVF